MSLVTPINKKAGLEKRCTIVINEENLIKLFDCFVWESRYRALGRPKQNITDYLRDSEVRIRGWEAELGVAIAAKNTHLRN